MLRLKAQLNYLALLLGANFRYHGVNSSFLIIGHLAYQLDSREGTLLHKF